MANAAKARAAETLMPKPDTSSGYQYVIRHRDTWTQKSSSCAEVVKAWQLSQVLDYYKRGFSSVAAKSCKLKRLELS